MNVAIRNGMHKLPWQPHVIAGVHKSGMLAAAMFAAKVGR
jgi:hypothetical protein